MYSRAACIGLLFCLTFGVVSCGNQKRDAPPVSPVAVRAAPAASTGPALLVLADAQINDNHGIPTFWGSSYIQKRLGQTVAHRSIQQTVLGDVLLKQIVKSAIARDQVPVIFLGDAMNMSCASEYERFQAAMNSTNAQWIALPGNHDGFYSGITLFRDTPDNRHRGKISLATDRRYGRDYDVWDGVCGPKGVLPKPAFAETYVNGVEHRFGNYDSSENSSNGECHSRTWSHGLLREMKWCSPLGDMDSRAPWHSFISQRLRIETATGPVDLVLLDSSVYAEEPCVLHLGCSDAGLTGGLGADQRMIAQRWIDDSYSTGTPVIVMAHHPFSDWTDDLSDQRWLRDNAMAGKVSMLVTAHTHFGCLRQPLLRDAPNFRELNIDSVIDHPSSYTRLWLTPRAGSLGVDFNVHPIDPSDFVQGGASACETNSADSDSIAVQTYGSTSGYTSQLVQIAAELSLVRRILSEGQRKSALPSILTAKSQSLEEESQRVAAALRAGRAKCAHRIFPPAADLDCEKKQSVDSLSQAITIAGVALEAQHLLTRFEDQPVWKALLASEEISKFSACLASSSETPYWNAVTTSFNARKQSTQCVNDKEIPPR